MPDPGGPDRPLIFAYDNGPANGPPIYPRPAPARPPARPRWPRLPRWPQWPGWLRPRLKRPHPFRRLADFLILLTAAVPEQIPSRSERFRYITVGLLMLVTAAQAFYAATLFMSVSLAKPFGRELGYGVFFAVAVYLVDRSIISYAAPIKLDGAKDLMPPKKTSWVVAFRVGIAIAAAMLMSEMILLQVFAGDISEQIQNDHIAASKATVKQIEASFQVRITPLENQITAAQNVVNQRQQDVGHAYQAMNCQEFGCPAQGITGGIGPGFAAAKVNWQNAVTRLNNAQNRLQSVHGPNQAQIKQLNIEEQQAINDAQPAISHADKVLSQEEAFWQLTVKNGTVLVVRLLLTLLILGIDLAPILTKLTGRTSMHDILAHSGDHRNQEEEKHETRTAVHQFATQDELNRRVRDIQLGTALFRAGQEDDVTRNRTQRQADVARAAADGNAEADLYRIDLETRLKKLRYYRNYYTAWQSRRTNRQGTDGGRQAGPGGRHAGPPPGRTPGPGRAPDPSRADDTARDYGLAFLSAPPTAGPQHATPGSSQQGAGPAPPHSPDPVPQPGPEPARPPGYPDRAGSPAAPPGRLPTGQTRLMDQMAEELSSQGPAGRLTLNRKWVLDHPMPGADPGGGGTVWQAYQLRDPSGTQYVVKTVPSELVDKRTREYIQQLGIRHEQRASAVVSDHLGKIIDHGEDQGFFYLVYPWYRPGSLWAYCGWKGDKRTLGWCAQVVYEILSGLIDASESHLVHLDIKPSNIVLDGKRARIIDWGLSRVWNAARPSTWIPGGTPFFACPEQLVKPQQGWDTPRADLYSVGATFYWLLTGEAPLMREARQAGQGTDHMAYYKLLEAKRTPQSVHDLVPGVPRRLGNLIDRWLSVDPDRRVPNGTAMEDSLRVARNQLSELQPDLPEMTVGRVTARRRR